MNTQQRKIYMKQKRQEQEEAAAKKRLTKSGKGMRGMGLEYATAYASTVPKGNLLFLEDTNDYSMTGLREAKQRNVGDVTDPGKRSQYIERRKREAKATRDARRR